MTHRQPITYHLCSSAAPSACDWQQQKSMSTGAVLTRPAVLRLTSSSHAGKHTSLYLSPLLLLSVTHPLESLFAARVCPGSLGYIQIKKSRHPACSLYLRANRHCSCNSQSGWRDQQGNYDSVLLHQLSCWLTVLQTNCENNTSTTQLTPEWENECRQTRYV